MKRLTKTSNHQKGALLLMLMLILALVAGIIVTAYLTNISLSYRRLFQQVSTQQSHYAARSFLIANALWLSKYGDPGRLNALLDSTEATPLTDVEIAPNSLITVNSETDATGNFTIYSRGTTRDANRALEMSFDVDDRIEFDRWIDLSFVLDVSGSMMSLDINDIDACRANPSIPGCSCMVNIVGDIRPTLGSPNTCQPLANMIDGTKTAIDVWLNNPPALPQLRIQAYPFNRDNQRMSDFIWTDPPGAPVTDYDGLIEGNKGVYIGEKVQGLHDHLDFLYPSGVTNLEEAIRGPMNDLIDLQDNPYDGIVPDPSELYQYIVIISDFDPTFSFDPSDPTNTDKDCDQSDPNDLLPPFCNPAARLFNLAQQAKDNGICIVTVNINQDSLGDNDSGQSNSCRIASILASDKNDMDNCALPDMNNNPVEDPLYPTTASAATYCNPNPDQWGPDLVTLTGSMIRNLGLTLREVDPGQN